MSWLQDGVWSGPPRGWRGGGKGNLKAQKERWNLKRKLQRKLATVRGEAVSAQAKAIAAQAKADALVAKGKALHLLASAAKEEAQHARALARGAEKEAAEHKDAAQKAHRWADGLWDRCRAALGQERIHLVGPPMLPDLRL